jgi:prepilin signal peptidase PulO-like enzyme (type II secretory pathway)
MEKECQQFKSQGLKSAMRLIYFKIMAILFLVVLFFYFLVFMYDTLSFSIIILMKDIILFIACAICSAIKLQKERTEVCGITGAL